MQKPNLMNQICIFLFGFSLTFSQIEFDVNWTPYVTYYLSMVDINTGESNMPIFLTELSHESDASASVGVNKNTIIARANLEYSF